MAIPVMAHAALPALLPTPPKWKMLPLLSTPPCVAAILPKQLTKPSRRADSDERWDACKTKPAASADPSASSSSSSGPPRSVDSVRRSSAGHGSSSPRKNATSPPPKPGRADSVERCDAHKKAASPASSSSSSSSSGSGTTSPLVSSSSKWPISRATSADRWDVHKERRPPQADQRLDDIDTEEEVLWKPRTMYAGLGFVIAAPESSMLPMPAALFLVPVA